MMDKSKLIKQRSKGALGCKFKSSFMFKMFLAGTLSRTVSASSLDLQKAELHTTHDKNVLLALRDILD